MKLIYKFNEQLARNKILVYLIHKKTNYMTKKTLLVIILLITSFSFSQIDLGKGISSNGYIADDGTFFCFSLSGSTGAGRWNFINIDTDGNRKVEKIIKVFFHHFLTLKTSVGFMLIAKKGRLL